MKALVTGKIPRDAIVELTHGELPNHFAGWRDVEYFKFTDPDKIQGYDFDGDPIGPGFEVSIKSLEWPRKAATFDASNVRVVVLVSGTPVIKRVFEIDAEIHPGRMMFDGSGYWGFKIPLIETWLGPWPLGVRACHPQYPHIVTAFVLNDDMSFNQALRSLGDELNQERASRT